MKKIIIKQLHTMDVLNEEAIKTIVEFNQSGKHLQLNVWSDYQDEDLETILDEGTYDYVATPEIEEMLNELADFAVPMMFDESDVLTIE